MNIITRFAPSPTGFLHIGGARTALFNWLLAKHYGGKFLLRIEDTDRERSTEEAVQAIFAGLKWLGLNWDEPPVFQHSKTQHHVELAKQLVASGKAYYCYCTPKELSEMRETAKAKGESPKYNALWRERDSNDAPEGIRPVIRLKSPLSGQTTLQDIVQGEVVVSNDQLDDMVLVRSDNTPTFMLSVVVDDHDMNITHVIRGDDHLTNTFRQLQIYDAFGWKAPKFGHIPLIHGSDGNKLSKRHGALGVEEYKKMGFLPESMCNFLLRLGWSHGNDEIISKEEAIEWFTTDNLGKSASRINLSKLESINYHYIKESDNDRLLKELLEIIDVPISDEKSNRLFRGMNGLKQRSKTLLELKDIASIYLCDDISATSHTPESIELLKKIHEKLNAVEKWTESDLEIELRNLSETLNVSFGKIAQLIRGALANRKITPSIFEMLFAFGKEESLRRILYVLI